MFAPEGYMPLTELVRGIESVMYDDILDLCISARRTAARDAGRSDLNYFFWLLPLEVIDIEVIFPSIINAAQIYTPQGKIVNIDFKRLLETEAKNSLSIFELQSHEAYYDENKEYLGLPDIPRLDRGKYNLFTSSREEFNTSFEVYKEEFGEKTIWEFTEGKENVRVHTELPFFFDRRSYTLSFCIFDYLREIRADGFFNVDMDELGDIIRILRPLEGSSLCIKTIDANTILDDLNHHGLSDGGVEAKSVGRPRLQERSVADYNSVFPSGHGKMSWKKVMIKIEDDTGRLYALDTLKRGLNLK